MLQVENVTNGISGSSSRASIIFNQLIHIHLLYFLGHYPGKWTHCQFNVPLSSNVLDITRKKLTCYNFPLPQPFVDSDHFIHKYFLPQDYAILVPVFAGVTLLSLLSVFIGMVMLKSKKKKA